VILAQYGVFVRIYGLMGVRVSSSRLWANIQSRSMLYIIIAFEKGLRGIWD
jgi:hypothetical protein